MTQQQPQRIHGSSPSPGQADQWAAAMLDTVARTLQDSPRSPDSRSPWEVTMAERTCIRILVRHYGWRMVEPGELRRVPRPRASAAMDARTTGAPSAAARVPELVRRLPA